MAGWTRSNKQSRGNTPEISPETQELMRQIALAETEGSSQGVAPIQTGAEGIAPIPASPSQPQMSVMTPDEYKTSELRQERIEAPESLQQRFNMELETSQRFMGESDIISAYGEVLGPEVVDSLVRVSENLDTLNTARMKGGTLEYQKSLADIRAGTEGSLQEAVEGDNTLDAGGKYKLDQKSLFASPVGLNAAMESQDSRGLVVDPDFLLTSFMTLEPLMAEQLSEFVPKELSDTSTREELDDLGLGTVKDNTDTAPLETIGKTIQQQWEMVKQVREGGDKITPDPSKAPRLSKEAYAAIGLWAQQAYSEANPGYLQEVNARDGEGFYQLTPAGAIAIDSRRRRVTPPKMTPRPIVAEAGKGGQPKYYSKEITRQTTGGQQRPKKNTKAEQAAEYYASVKHVADPMRSKIAFFWGLLGIDSASKVRMDQEENYTGIGADFFGVGKDRIDKIRNAHLAASLKAREISDKIKDTYDFDRLAFLEKKLRALKDFIALSKTPQWQQGMYKLHATKQLEMLNDLALFKDDAISFTFARQIANSRLTIQQTKMNPQSHKIARNVFGSGTNYKVNPRSGSDAEFAMVATFGANLLNLGDMKPMQVYKEFHRMLKSGDNVEMAKLARAGQELQSIFDAYDPSSTVDALAALESGPKGINGVDKVIGLPEVEAAKAAIQGSSQDTKAFLNAAGQHPDEFVVLLESAMEFAKYMDSAKSGKPFFSKMRPSEVDGISNGLAALLAQLGEKSAMYRVGVLSDDPQKIIGSYLDFEGDLRDVLKDNILMNSGDYLSDNEFRTNFSITDEEIPLISEAIGVAVKDKANFLKPPLMTLPYGQSVDAMIGTVYNTVVGSAPLGRLAQELGGEQRLSQILHGILVSELTSTLGPNVINYINLLQSSMEVTSLLDSPLRYTQAVGTETSVSNKRFVREQINPVRVKMRPLTDTGEFLDPSEDGPHAVEEGMIGSDRSFESATTPVDSAIASRGGIAAGAVRAAVAPQVIIGFDGATIINLVTGLPLSRLQRQNGGRDPYVLPIFDAILTDLGSFKSVTKEINKVWTDLVLHYDLLGELDSGLKKSKLEGLKRMHQAAIDNPKGIVENPEHAEYLQLSMIRAINRVLRSRGVEQEAHKRNLNGRFETLMKVNKSLNQISRVTNKSQAEVMTNAHAYNIASILTNSKEYEKISNDFSKIAKAAHKGRQEIVKELKDSHQFAPDKVKMSF